MDGLWLATVVVEFSPPNGQLVEDLAEATWIRDTLMEEPAVATVRPDGGDLRWLYRMDVEAAPTAAMEAFARSPAALVAERGGWEYDVARVGWMSDAERRKFHFRFWKDV